MEVKNINRDKIINEISKIAFCDIDSDIKMADKIRALSLLNSIIKDEEKGTYDTITDKLFIDDLE